MLDLKRMPYRVTEATWRLQQAHRIGFIRYPEFFDEAALEELKDLEPCLLLAPDDLLEPTLGLANRLETELRPTPFSALGPQAVADHWALMRALETTACDLDLLPPAWSEPTNASAVLCSRFLARQANWPPAISDSQANTDSTVAREILVDTMLMILACSSLEQTAPAVPAAVNEAEVLQAQNAALKRFRPYVILASRPAPQTLEDVGKVDIDSQLLPQHTAWDALEVRRVAVSHVDQLFDFLVSHRALAQRALPWDFGLVPSVALHRLRELEVLCHQNPRSNKKIWWVLRQIGSQVAGLFDRNACSFSKLADFVTCISDFPIGLTVLPGHSSPLQCSVPVVYRPVSPLGGAVDYELSDRPLVYLRGGFRVLIAECVPLTDPVHSVTSRAWRLVQDQVRAMPQVHLEIVDVSSINELNRKLSAEEIDLLLLSAHGTIDSQRNVACLAIGQDTCFGHELNYVPPVTILSACSAMPRAFGTASIAEMLLLRGAVTVVAPTIPVNAVFNGQLLLRLFAAIVGGMQGTEQFWRFDQAWCEAAACNTITDILSSSPELVQWELTHHADLIEEYLAEERAGRIRRQHIHKDVEAFLGSYADKTGFGENFKKVMDERSYFPETLFYVLAGRAERIILRDESGEAFRAKSTEFDSLGRRRGNSVS